MVNNQFRNRNAKSEYGKAEMSFLTTLQQNKIRYVTQVHMLLPLQPEEDRQIRIVPDYVIMEKLVTFIDGDIHLKPSVRDKDKKVDDILVNQMGLKVLRLSNEEVLDKSVEGKDAVMKKIWGNI